MKYAKVNKIFTSLITLIILMSCSGTPATTPDQTVKTDDQTPTTPLDRPSQDQTTDLMIGENAIVEKIEVYMIESFPAQVNVIIYGNLPNGCTEISHIMSTIESNSFIVSVYTQRTGSEVCPEALFPFQKDYTIDIEGLPAGSYKVDVYGKKADFTLASDNTPADEPPEPTPLEVKDTIITDEAGVEENAYVDSIQILIMESFPLQVSLSIQGNLPDGCTSIKGIVSELDDNNTFTVRIFTARPKDLMCTMALVPFEERHDLDVKCLPAGSYTVNTYGVTGIFKFDVDNFSPGDPQCSSGQ